MFFYLRPLIALALIFLTSCTTTPLSLRTEFIGRQQLASYYVRSPDPHLAHPDIGERLIIQWSLSAELFAFPKLHILVTVRFQNGEEEVFDYLIDKKNAFQLLHIVNEKFQETGGILTYKAELLSEQKRLLEWHHQLWNETIIIPIP